MRNEIDYKKLESCMVELFCEPEWDMYDKESRWRIQFLTADGQVISIKNFLVKPIGYNNNTVHTTHQDMVDHVGELFKMEVKMIDFIKTLKMCRVNIPGGHNRKSSELNITTFNPLTTSQRRFFLDVIEGLHISPDKIFIDDCYHRSSTGRRLQSKQLISKRIMTIVKRQLGLHFFD